MFRDKHKARLGPVVKNSACKLTAYGQGLIATFNSTCLTWSTGVIFYKLRNKITQAAFRRSAVSKRITVNWSSSVTWCISEQLLLKGTACLVWSCKFKLFFCPVTESCNTHQLQFYVQQPLMTNCPQITYFPANYDRSMRIQGIQAQRYVSRFVIGVMLLLSSTFDYIASLLQRE